MSSAIATGETSQPKNIACPRSSRTKSVISALGPCRWASSIASQRCMPTSPHIKSCPRL
ncbi:hypothetical protein CSPAE12_01266 [Colletotrichum incanum]|nr:hypothetical protein CSPAE12_01266 [Colletotrichum incanum]